MGREKGQILSSRIREGKGVVAASTDRRNGTVRKGVVSLPVKLEQRDRSGRVVQTKKSAGRGGEGGMKTGSGGSGLWV